MRVPDGNIVAIGGLMSQRAGRTRARRFPELGDVPLSWAACSATARAHFAKRELVILIKPTVIQSERDWAEDLARTREPDVRLLAARRPAAWCGSEERAIVYLRHFGLKELPFVITPDTAYAFESRSQREALNTLLVAQELGEGFIKIVGEVGTGKTLLCRQLPREAARRHGHRLPPEPRAAPAAPCCYALAQELRI